MFSCEFCKIPKNTFFTEHLRTTVSVVTEGEQEGAEHKVKRISNNDWCVCNAKAVFGRCSSK